MHRSPNKVSRGNKQNIARLFLLESPPRFDIICESGGNRTDGLNKTLTQNINLCAGSSHFVTSLISSFTGARGRYLRKAIIPAQQQPLPLGLCTFKISHDQKPAGRSPAPVTCCLQILRNRVYHYSGVILFLLKISTIIWDIAYNPCPPMMGEDSVCSTFILVSGSVSYPTCPLMPGQQRRKSGRGVIKQTTFQPAHILSLLCVDTTNTL